MQGILHTVETIFLCPCLDRALGHNIKEKYLRLILLQFSLFLLVGAREPSITAENLQIVLKEHDFPTMEIDRV